MKEIFIWVFFALVGSPVWASSPANIPANPFQDDLSCLDHEFAGMSALEQLVNERNATYITLAAEQNALLNSVIADNDIASSLVSSAAPSSERLLGISGFWWGCCFSLLGVILVYVALDGDLGKEEGKKAVIGCLILPAVIVLLYLVLFALSTSFWLWSF